MLGGFELRIDGVVMPSLPYDKARALLALLMIEPRAHAREQLAEMLWPGAPMEQARANLRRALFDLRRCLDQGVTWAREPLRADRNTLALDPDAAHWHVDALAITQDAGQDADMLERQAALYRGPLLAGLLLADAPLFDLWLMGWRERVANHMLRWLARLADLHEQGGRDAQALECCRRSLDIDAWQEPVQRRCLELLARHSPATALKHYEDFRQRLADELGIAPEGATRALADEIRARVGAVVASSMPERRRIVVLACDLETEALDPELRVDRLRPVVAAAADVIARHEGQLVQSDAGELLAYFGCPVAHESSPRRALDAAVALRQQMQTCPDIVSRVGVHAGWALVALDHVSPDAVGVLSKRARRLAWAAPAGGVRVSADMLMLCDRHFVFEPADTDEWLLGGRLPHGQPARAGSGPLPMYGRERELGLLQQAWAGVQGGAAAAWLLCGEPGLGKSRLAQALAAEARAQGAQVTDLVCQPETSHRPYQPLLSVLAAWMGAAAPDVAVGQGVSAVRRLLSSAGLDHPAAVTTLQRLMGAPLPQELPDPVERRRQEEALLMALFDRLGGDRPQLLIVEDLHWADPSTLEWLGRFLAVARTPTLLLCTSRPPVPAMSLAFTGSFELGPLSHEAMCRLLAGSGLGPAVQRDVVRRADGIPLYAEEMVRALHDAPGEPVPPTLWSLLASRLDALGPLKRLAQEAALIGRDFDQALLAAISSTPQARLDHALQGLCASGLVLGGARQQYRFRHALIRDVAHQSLPLAERRALHRRVADALRSSCADRGEESPELVAHHLMAAGDPQAARYWLVAGQRGAAQSAYTEACHDFEQGLQALNGLHEGDPLRQDLEVPLRLSLGACMLAQQGYGSKDARACFNRACQLSEVRGGGELFQALWGKWLGTRCGEDDVPPLVLADRLMTLARQTGDAAAVVQACYALGNNHFFAGHLALARRWLQEAVQRAAALVPGLLIERCGEDVGLSAQGILSWTLALQGEVTAADEVSRQCVAMARAGGHAQSQCNALACAAAMRHHLRQHAEAALLSDELMRMAQAYGLALWQAVAVAIRGWSQRGQGGLAELEAVKDGVRSAAMAMPSIEGTMQLFVVDTQLTVGRADEAITTIAEVLPRIVVRHETYVRAEMWRLQGEALLQSGQPAAKATALFSQALAAAQADGATLLELRAACSLARLAPSDVEALARVARSLARMAPQPALEDWTSAMALLQGRTVAHLTA